MRDNAKSGALTEVTFFILLSLYEPRHGYAIMQFVEEQTGGRLLLGAGSLYGALNNLTKKGLIAPLGEDTERRRQYRITSKGQRIVEGELARLKEVTQIAAAIMEKHPKAAGMTTAKSVEEAAGKTTGKTADNSHKSGIVNPQGWEAAGV